MAWRCVEFERAEATPCECCVVYIRTSKRQWHSLSIYGVKDIDNVLPSTVLGIDPGVSGGIACWRRDEPMIALPMPETEGDQIELIRKLVILDNAVVFLEQVGGFTGKGQPGSAMFKFGRSFGFTLGVLQTLGVRVELVRPQTWQKPFGLGTASNCATRREWKNKLKACAQRLYPALKPTLSTADAILILEYGLKSFCKESIREKSPHDDDLKSRIGLQALAPKAPVAAINGLCDCGPVRAEIGRSASTSGQFDLAHHGIFR